LSRLDDMVRRKLTALFNTGVLDDPPVRQDIDFAAGEKLSQEVAGRSMVLLKNSRQLLPLSKSLTRIAIIGKNADSSMLSGGGSSQVLSPGGAAHIYPAKADQTCAEQPGAGNWCEYWIRNSPKDAIQAKVSGATVSYADGSDTAAAATLARNSDVAVVIAHQWTTEGTDLTSLTLRDKQDDLIAAVAAANSRTVVVVQSGNPVLMPWLNRVGAVVEAWFAGNRGAQALADVLFGDVNPSGKLPISFPAAETETPTGGAAFSKTDVPYTEGMQIGYRWYDAKGVTPLFAFGHGLSYTRYTYTRLQTATDGTQVSFSVTNNGTRAGTEIAQVYVSLPSSAGDVPKRLVGWSTVTLAASEAKQVTVKIPRDRLNYWDTASSSWKTAAGTYQVMVGASSDDIKLQSTFTVR
jgi:beta-glucosidase